MTISSTPNHGDVVILEFDFLDGTGSKVRPAVVLSYHGYNAAHGWFVFAPLTGSAGSVGASVEIGDLGIAGLNRRSYLNGMLFTAVNAAAKRTVGRLGANDLAAVKDLVRSTLQL